MFYWSPILRESSRLANQRSCKYKTNFMIYNMDESTEKLTLYKTLQTGGAYGVEYFSIADKHFLAVANQ